VKPFIILNPIAGSVEDLPRIVNELQRLRPAKVLATKRSGDAERWSHRAVKDGFNYLVVAGGDGTLNEVINGVARTQAHPRIGIVPLGTGNDFARGLDLPLSLKESVAILRAGRARPADIVRVRSKRVRYFVNVAAGGFSGIVRRKMTPEIKRGWGPLAYLRGAAAALPKLHAYKARIVLDGEEVISTSVYNVVIANGRFAAGGLPIAPAADPFDALLDVVLIPKRSAPEMALLAAEIILGKHFSTNTILFRRAKRISVRSKPGMSFNVDGELIGSVPATFQILPHRLKFVIKE
jgi:diacylglycerol kinase (ATP)